MVPINRPPTSLEEWLQNQAVYASEPPGLGSGNHPDEISALQKYFSGHLNAHEAALAIILPAISHSQDPKREVLRIWGLLGEPLAELGPEVSDRTIVLLMEIQKLPPTGTASGEVVRWEELPGFMGMWLDLYGCRFESAAFGKSEEEDRRLEGIMDVLRKGEEDVGTAEAKMWRRIPRREMDLQGLGYRVLNLVCLARDERELEVDLWRVRAWLRGAGRELWAESSWDEVKRFPKARTNGRYVSATMEEHWEEWESALADIAVGKISLSLEGRGVATECFVLMMRARFGLGPYRG